MANTLRFKRGLVTTIPTAALGEPLFTTDTFDLYIGNGTTNTRFQKYIASGTTSQLLRGDGSLLTMPIVLTSPSNGQVLKFNGTNWVNDSDAGITGSGSPNYLPKFTGATTLGNSVLQESSNNIGIGGVPDNYLNFRFLTLDGTDGSVISYKKSGTTFAEIGGDGNVLNIDAKGSRYIGLYTNATQRARITAGGNFIINNPSTDNGLRFQVTGDGYFSGSVGIGTTPSYKLHVAGNLYVNHNDAPIATFVRNGGSDTNTVIAFGNATTTTYFGTNGTLFGMGGSTGAITNQPFIIVPSATEKLRLDSSGNLGLGVVPSAWGSAYYKALELTGGALTSYQTASVELFFNSFDDASSSFKYKNTGFASRYVQVAGEHRWFTAPSGTSGAAITYTRPMTLDASGRLLLGSGSVTSELLQVNGTMRVSGASTFVRITAVTSGITLDYNAGILYHNGGSGSYYQLINGANYLLFNRTATGSLILGTQDIARLTIASTGAATFSSSVTAGGAITVNTTANGINLIQSTIGSATYYVMQNTVETGGKRYRFGYTGASPDKGSFSIYNETDAITPFLIASTGAATFSSSVTSASLIVSGSSTSSYIGSISQTNTTAGVSFGLLVRGGTNSSDIALNVQSAASSNLFRVFGDGQAILTSLMTAGSFIPTSSTAPSNGMYLAASNTLAFSTSTTEAMRITSSGSIGINSPTTNSERLVVRQTTNSVYSAGIYTSASTGTSFGLRVQAGTNSSDAAMQILSQAGSTYLFLRGDNNLGFGTSLVGATGTNTMSVFSGTAPSSNLTDTFQMYSADVTAGNAAPHFRTENGAVIKLYQQDNSIAAANFVAGIGTSVTTLDAFDGYTIGQVVKALRNAGILS